MFKISAPCKIETPLPLRDIAKEHGISVIELKNALKTDHKREKNKIKKRNKRMEFFLTNTLPMDCVNEILGYMPQEVRRAINKLLIQDKIERIPSILSTMELKHIMRHINYGRLQFIKDEAINSETYDTTLHAIGFEKWYSGRWRVYLDEAIHYKSLYGECSSYEELNKWIDKQKTNKSFSISEYYSDPNKYYKIYYSNFQKTDKEKIRNLGYYLKMAFEHMFGSRADKIDKTLQLLLLETEEDRHKKLNKMLDAFMKLPPVFKK